MIPKELQKMYDEAVGTRDKILASLEPLRKKEDELQEKVDNLSKKLKLVREEIVTIEGSELADASKIISALAQRAHRLKAESGDFGVKMT